MDRIELITPTELYNILNAESSNGTAWVTNSNFLLLLDAREYARFEAGHIKMAVFAKRNNEEFTRPPFRQV